MTDKPVGYCLKCKQKRELRDAERVTLKSNRLADKGTCAVCGTSIFRFIGSQKKEVKA